MLLDRWKRLALLLLLVFFHCIAAPDLTNLSGGTYSILRPGQGTYIVLFSFAFVLFLPFGARNCECFDRSFVSLCKRIRFPMCAVSSFPNLKNKKIAVDFMEIFMIDFEMFVNRFERNKCRPLECCFR